MRAGHDRSVLARRVVERALAGDPAVRDDVTRHFQLHIPFLGPLPRGHRGLLAGFALFREGIPEPTLTLDDFVDDGAHVGARFTLEGKHDGPFVTMRPTGRPIRASGLVMWRFTGERVAEMWSYINVWQVVREQLAVYDLVNTVVVEPI